MCLFFVLASMIRLYHREYLTDEYLTLPVAYFVPSLMSESASNSLIPFDTSIRTMLDEIMMWCVVAHLPEELVRFLLSLLPELNFKVQSIFHFFILFFCFLAFIYRNISPFLWYYRSITHR